MSPSSSSPNPIAPSSTSKSFQISRIEGNSSVSQCLPRSSAAHLHSSPTMPLGRPRGSGFKVEKLYEFDAPQFYDFGRQSDPERLHSEENWFDYKRRTPSTPDFNFVARSSSFATIRPKSVASSKLGHKSNIDGNTFTSCQSSSGSTGGLSFLNTPIGKGKNFFIPSSAGEMRSSASHESKSLLKRSATIDNVTNAFLTSENSSAERPSMPKRFREIGSDEKKIISGFMSTPLMVIKTPNPKTRKMATSNRDVPKSPLYKIACNRFGEESLISGSILARETSSFDQHSSSSPIVAAVSQSPAITERKRNEIPLIPSTSSTLDAADFFIKQRDLQKLCSASDSYKSFQQELKTRARFEKERIAALEASSAKRLQKLKAGPTILPTKSIKPLTVPEEFRFGQTASYSSSVISHRSQAKLLSSRASRSAPAPFIPTVPKSPPLASKYRAQQRLDRLKNRENNENSSLSKEQVDLRRKLEFKSSSNFYDPSYPSSSNKEL